MYIRRPSWADMSDLARLVQYIDKICVITSIKFDIKYLKLSKGGTKLNILSYALLYKE